MNRRQFLAAGSVLASSASATLPRRLLAARSLSGAIPSADGAELKALAHAALDAARTAGARYADVLFRATRTESWELLSLAGSAPPREATSSGVGIRALVGGCWGFAGLDGTVDMDAAAKLGRTAAAQAKVGADGPTRPVDLAPAPVVRDGHWVTPVDRDPFDVSADEKIDFLSAVNDYITRLAWYVSDAKSSLEFRKVETTMASTEGADYDQTTYTTAGSLDVGVKFDCVRGLGAYCAADFLTPAGAGWEYIRKAPFREAAPELIETANRSRGQLVVESGRYDVVFDAYAIAAILSATLGQATALDRAMGITAKGVGTSFLSDPLAMLGQLQVAAPSITVTANRSMPHGAATVRWDDEGVAPSEVKLVDGGVLAGLHGTRESASWLAPYYQRIGRAVRSTGCAWRGRATELPAQYPPNLALAAGRDALSFEDLVRSTKRGYAICGGRVSTDWQCLNGVGRAGRMYLIRNGQLGEAVDVDTVRYLLRAPEFWKSVVALGGAASARAFGIELADVGAAHTVRAVPAKITQLRFVPS